jgi:hypothetical protein
MAAGICPDPGNTEYSSTSTPRTEALKPLAVTVPEMQVVVSPVHAVAGTPPSPVVLALGLAGEEQPTALAARMEAEITADAPAATLDRGNLPRRSPRITGLSVRIAPLPSSVS